MSQISLFMKNSLANGNGDLWDATEFLRSTWKHKTRRVGGYWSASGEYRHPKTDRLEEMFYNGLQREVIAAIGSKMIWQGYIGALALTRNGYTWTRSLANSFNAIKSLFTRIFDSLLTNGSAESGAWTAYNGATVTQSTEWVADGNYSCKIVVADTTIRGARISGSGYGLTIAANTQYDVAVSINALSGSWRVSVNRSDTDESLGFFSTRGEQGQFIASFTIPDTNTYAGTVDFRITSEASAGTIYGDFARFTPLPVAADTGWLVDANSINQFGRIEKVIVRGGLSNDAANAEIATLLAQSAWCRTLPPDQFQIGRSAAPDEKKLALTLVGYVNTLGNLTTATSGSTTLSGAISAMLAQSDVLSTGKIDTNSTDFMIENRAPVTLWRVMLDAIKAGDATGQRWFAGVLEDRKFYYQAVATEPGFFLRSSQVYYKTELSAEPFYLRPGYYQLDDMPLAVTPASGDANDELRRIFVEEVEYVAATNSVNLSQRMQ